MYPERSIALAEEVLQRCRDFGYRLVTVESCTGGLIAGCFTEIAGSSDVLECGFVTYSNEAKTALVGVPARIIAENGAVSEIVARAMAEGARERTGCALSVSATGVAGPGGGTTEKPVGLVHVACARREKPTLHNRCDFGDRGRGTIRQLAVRSALELMLEQLAGPMLA